MLCGYSRIPYLGFRGFHTATIACAAHPQAKFSLRKKKSATNIDTSQEDTTPKNALLEHPSTPARTRFAPSPTGFLHLGSLRTALYNYLLAKSTKGQFLLRLEDTDQNRLVQGAEENIYETLKFLKMKIDEGPIEGGPHSPYRQSERSAIYSKYADELLEKGLAYRCFCSKSRLDNLRDSARQLKPPTTVSYDRHCHKHHTKEESDRKAAEGESFTVRFLSPSQYPEFVDLLHGPINHQPQVNPFDRRYEDPVLLKSDGLPTYHFANVIDDHIMEITHVVRGEEWLASTAKHISLYDAFNWDKPDFIHIPLLTTVDDKKLSKRSGDIDIMSLTKKGYLPEALVNFSVLFGWSPKRELGQKASEVFDMETLETVFNIEGLTVGNAKVDFKKLDYFNKHYLGSKLKNDPEFFQQCVENIYPLLVEKYGPMTESFVATVLKHVSHSLTKLTDLSSEMFSCFFARPSYSKENLIAKVKIDQSSLNLLLAELLKENDLSHLNVIVEDVLKSHPQFKKKDVFQTLRYAISGEQPGINLPTMIEILGSEEILHRIGLLQKCILDS